MFTYLLGNVIKINSQFWKNNIKVNLIIILLVMISCFCWTTSFIINSIYFLWNVNFQKHCYLEYICTFGRGGMVFNSFLYRGEQFYWWKKSQSLEKTTDLSQVIDKLYHIKLYQISRTPRHEQNSSSQV